MNILSANLKHLYQRKSCWLFGLLFVATAFAIIMMIAGVIGKNKLGAFYAPSLWMLYMGVFAATLAMDVLTKPFSYCLPGHQNATRNFLFSVGLPLAFLWSLIFLFFPGLDFAETVLAHLAAFSLFTIFYWVGVLIVFKFKAWAVIVGFLPLMIISINEFNINEFIVRTILEGPLLIIFAGILINVSAWHYWSRSDLARRYCGKSWMGLLDAWNKEKIEKNQLDKLREKDRKKPDAFRISPSVERFFIARISGAETDNLRQYIWGSLYKNFGVALSQFRRNWMRSFITILLLLCFLGYFVLIGNILFFIPGVMVIYMNLNIHSNLLISGGRRERFWSALTLAVVTTVFATFFVISVAAFSMLLEPLLPELTIKGETFVFCALNIKLFFVPLLIIPITLTIGLILHKSPILAMFLTVISFLALFSFNTVSQLTPAVSRDFSPAAIIMLFCVTWGIFTAVLRYITMRRCLVG